MLLTAIPPVRYVSMLPLAIPIRGRAVNSQFELIEDVAESVVGPKLDTPELADRSQPLKSVSKPSRLASYSRLRSRR